MTDLALIWGDEDFEADLALAISAIGGVDLSTDDGLRTATIVSLFTDARAKDDDPLPVDGDRRGWWGDALADQGDNIGSRLWLLSREKQLNSVLERARQYATEALQWLVADQVAAKVEVETQVVRTGVLGLAVTITRPTGERRRFDFAWNVVAEEAA